MKSTSSEMEDIIPVILAGGQGLRLRPLSTAKNPKPFLRILSPYTLLQQTALRVKELRPPAIAAAASLRERVASELAAIGITPQQIFLEPEGRNTAPAIAVAAHYFAAGSKSPLMLVVPSDHAIKDPATFLAAVRQGATLARRGRIVLFGIKPSRPETGYGYIERGTETAPGIFAVSSFAEKPDRQTAKRFIRSGGYLWNSGIFLFSTGIFLDELKRLAPGLHENSFQAVARASRLQNAVFLEKEAFTACPPVSLDRAIIEKAGNLCVIPLEMGWRDLGCWPELMRHVLRAG